MAQKQPSIPALRSALRKILRTYSKTYLRPRFDPKLPKVRLHEPTYGAGEIWEALDSLLTTRVTMGEKVHRFERDYAEYFGFPNAVMVNSGSSANLLAVSALTNPARPDRLKAGDEVIVPALAWSTTVWPIIQHQLIPVIVDIDPQTLNIDPNAIELAVGPKTRGVMPVHVYGNPCDMKSILAIARRRNLAIIEDCCEAIGASHGGRPVGSFGQIGTFSFYFSHHMTTMEGGMCVTADEELADLMRILRAHGWVRETRGREKLLRSNPGFHPGFLFVNIGYNLRATELQGGFGSVQLKKLKSFIDVRTANARFWHKTLGKYGNVFDFQKETPGGVHSWFGFPMSVKSKAPFGVRDLTDFLNARGIETRPIIAGNIAAQPAMKYYAHRVSGDLRHAKFIMKNGFTFGNHQAVGVEARAYVVETIGKFLAERGIG